MHSLFFYLLLLVFGCRCQQIGVNWAFRMSHRLHPPDVVAMLKANNISRVKLFDAEPVIMKALAGSGLEVMLGVPNTMLPSLASLDTAEDWVENNLTPYIKSPRRPVNIRYIAVGSEPFQNDLSEALVLAALRNVQQALNDQSLRVKATVTFSQGDVYTDDSHAPSTGRFRDPDRRRAILEELSRAKAPLTVNIYPFFSRLFDPNFSLEFAFFDGNAPPLQDNSFTYTNAFDAIYDTVLSALQAAGFADVQIIVGETGWPSDSESFANLVSARRFNQGLLKKLATFQGTPLRPQSALHVYMFNLFDEDLRSTHSGNFERHWGLFQYDGQPKYELTAGGGSWSGVKDVEYLNNIWCVYDRKTQAPAEVLEAWIVAACAEADCSSLSEYGSCNTASDSLEDKASYAFNSRFQLHDQNYSACDYKYTEFVKKDPSTSNCRFIRQIRVKSASATNWKASTWYSLVLMILHFYVT